MKDPNRRRLILVQAAATVGVFLILWARNPAVLMRPEFWAEDAVIYFRQAYIMGLRALFSPLGGYQNLIPRIIAWLAAQGSPEWASQIYAVSAFGITSVALAWFCRPGFAWLIPSPWLRLAFIFLAAIGPGITEISQAICNLHTVLALWWIGLILEADTVWGPGRIAGMVLLALSTPELPISVPLLLGLWWKSGDRKAPAILGLVVVCLASNALFSHLNAAGGYGLELNRPGTILGVSAQRTLLFTFFLPFVGPELSLQWLVSSAAVHWLLLILGVGLLAACLRSAKLEPKARWAVLGLWTVPFFYFAMMWAARPYLWHELVRSTGTLFWIGRYGFVSWNVALLSLFTLASGLWRSPVLGKRALAGFLVAAASYQALSNPGIPFDRPDLHWPEQAAHLKQVKREARQMPLGSHRLVDDLTAHPSIKFDVSFSTLGLTER